MRDSNGCTPFVLLEESKKTLENRIVRKQQYMRRRMAIMKKLLTTILSAILVLGMSFGFSGCLDKRWQEIFDQVNQIEKSADFALVDSDTYMSAQEEIDFFSLLKEKIQEDGKKAELTDWFCARYQGNICQFLYRYKEENRLGGLNDKNNHYAVGTISLTDYSISVKYFKCAYEKLKSSAFSETHHLYGLEDTDKEIKDGQYEVRRLTINRNSGEVREWEDAASSLAFIGERIPSYSPPTTYTENGVEYILSDTAVFENNEQHNTVICVPTYANMLEKTEEMKIISEILSRESGRLSIEGHFLTNGEDLFVGFISSYGMFGWEGDLVFPVVFKCDLSLETFEYVGCINMRNCDFYKYLEVRRIA